jgi:hypothetical protein
MKPYPGGGYVATGFLSDEGYESGFLCRVDDDCNPVWQRLDTAFVEDEYATNKLAASGFLSSGSIIACGQSVNWAEEKSYAWLLKITPDGCIDTLFCNPIVSALSVPVPEPIAVQVFPNPSNNQVLFNTIPTASFRLEILNLQGLIVTSLKTDHRNTLTLDVSNYASGMYFYRFYSETGIMSIGKFLVQH